MLKTNENKGWLSAYLYFKGNVYGPECDRLLVDIIEPFIKSYNTSGYYEKYFFIRYNEWGSHIRLRLFGNNKLLNSNIKPL